MFGRTAAGSFLHVGVNQSARHIARGVITAGHSIGSSLNIGWPRYRKTGTPLNKELREYVEEMNKAKGKVEPEKVGSSTEKDTPEMQAVQLMGLSCIFHQKDSGSPLSLRSQRPERQKTTTCSLTLS